MVYCTACSSTDQKSLFGIIILGFSNLDDITHFGILLVLFFNLYNVFVVYEKFLEVL